MTHDARRVAFDGIRALRNSTGLGNYARGVLRGLRAASRTLELHVYSSKPARAPYESDVRDLGATIHYPHGIWSLPGARALWRTHHLGRAAAHGGAEVYHGLTHEIPRDLLRTGVPSIVTFADVIYRRHPEWFGAVDRRSYEWRYRWSAEHADAIVAISAATRDDLVAAYDVDPARIVVIPPARDSRFAEPVDPATAARVARKFDLPSRYLLSVGTLEARKNHRVLLAALSQLDPQLAPLLVIVGRDAGMLASLRAEADALGMASRVKFLSSVPGEELVAITAGATVSLYPSLLEGFGMPIVEALSAGVPVVASRGGCFPEAGGAESLYAAATDPQEWAAAITRIVTDPDLAARMRAAGRRHAEGFAERLLAEHLLGVYDAVVARRPLPSGVAA